MKYSIIFLFFLFSCGNYSANINKKSGYSSSGFAYIEKNFYSDLANNDGFISHDKLRLGTKIRIVNPNNKKSIESTIKKKIKYDKFYKILISKNIAEKLDLSLEFPFVEIYEIKSNKSFIAKKPLQILKKKK